MTSIPQIANTGGFSERFLNELVATAQRFDHEAVDRLAGRLAETRRVAGRVFIVGLGGSAANASHAACDLRGLANIEAYTPADSPASLTAAANDYGWRQAFTRWLLVSRIGAQDVLLVLSVGGGSEDPPVSENLIEAVKLGRAAGAFTVGIVGPDGGETARLADLCVRIPIEDAGLRTTHTEIFQAVVWHMLATHPLLQQVVPRWESLRP
ncbi:SIS domain-containing protein [Phytohabitans sp. LJ34]|uniref:SIS domain-containing protein n=1 Tax=Phytohabitans sp. LJ34 TaxID=3452217 RepID=UPI003F8913B1